MSTETPKNLTPMLAQYFNIKRNYPDTILLFRLGDFYEMFNQDAIKAAKILDITLTARYRGTDKETPMCGIPHHALEIYVAKLTKAGEKAAICDQVSNPSLPGIVERKVTRVITPGTTLNEAILAAKENNYLVSIEYNKHFGLAMIDLSTGEFKAAEIDNLENLKNELTRIRPTEILLPSALKENTEIEKILRYYHYNSFERSRWQSAENIILEHFKISGLESFGLKNLPLATEAAARILVYLKELRQGTLEHINKIIPYAINDYMLLDEATIRNLEIFRNNYNGGEEHTLIKTIDLTQTSMGARTLRQWMFRPLINQTDIINRLSAIEELYQDSDKRQQLQNVFKQISDLERLIGRIGCDRANGKDLSLLKETLLKIPLIKQILISSTSHLLITLNNNLNDHRSVIELIAKTIIDEPPVSIVDGGMIKDGVNVELDEIRKISHGGKDWIRNFQTEEVNRTGINSLKVKFNNIFGYYIEVTKSNLGSIPANYIRKQTIANGERYITPELKEYEEKVLGAEEKIKILELKLFQELTSELKKYLKDIQTAAARIAVLDVINSFAELARQNNYTKPEITVNGKILIKDGRHPVIEKIAANYYVPNNLYLDQEKQQLIILTGPNMSGKSSYIRQNGLIVLMAQIGCFVPASFAEISLVDRIFTRVGASDNIARGQSTFMVEMQEAANIINNATNKSLIIFDELGRGTSTYDGVSIAWAIVKYVHDKIQAKTLFATHYHELIKLAEELPRAANYSVLVKEDDKGEVVFLHQVRPGAINKSYGVDVAKLAGLPAEIINQARIILEQLSAEEIGNKPKIIQGDLFDKEKQPSHDLLSKTVVEKIKTINLDNLTPLQAFNLVEEIKKMLDK